MAGTGYPTGTSTVDTITTLDAFNVFFGTHSWTDAQINQAINYVSQAIRSYCNRDFNVRNYDEWYRVQDYNQLYLKQYPIVEITSVERSTTKTNGDATTVNYDVFDDANGIINLTTMVEDYHYALNFSVYHSRYGYWYHVVYSAGYATIPFDLEMIANEMVASFLLSAQRDKAIRTLQLGDAKYTVDDNKSVIDQFYSRLDPYRKFRL